MKRQQSLSRVPRLISNRHGKTNIIDEPLNDSPVKFLITLYPGFSGNKVQG